MPTSSPKRTRRDPAERVEGPKEPTRAPSSPEARRGRGAPATGRSYRWVVIVFAVTAVVVGCAIAFLTLSSLAISVRPVPRPIATDLEVKVQPDAAVESESPTIRGMVLRGTRTGERTYPATGTTRTVDGRAEGIVTITNTYSRNQPLVETTRLLSPNGIQVRTTESVVVPAGGSVTVRVIADEPGAAGNLPPTRFSIPGLWSGFVDVIYAENAEPLTGGVRTVHVVTAEELDAARTQTEDALTQELLPSFTADATLPVGTTVIPALTTTEVRSATTTPDAADAEAESIAVQMEIAATAVAVDEQALDQEIRSYLASTLARYERLADPDGSITTVELLTSDEVAGSATIRVTLAAAGVPETTHPLLDRSRFLNKDADDIAGLFADQEDFELVSVQFVPFRVPGVPTFTSQIRIRILDPDVDTERLRSVD
ncbi:MAG: baseplate J/gp47 family protein [Candidatus Kerfeldbacteria bacterium]|nr:baseplate J/gp47 family protein [Candidatus Kerfeldbacteria bacterium]